MRRYLLLALFVTAALALASCAKESSAPEVIENYLKAKVASNADELSNLACKDWEAKAQQDAASFESVKAELQNMSCKEDGKDGQYTLVTCDGKLIIEYRGEDPREQDLSDTTYLALKEDNEWKMCGEQ